MAADGDDVLGATFAAQRGWVESFDDHVGSGTVRNEAGGARWPFHCTRIADGSRTIAVDTAVTYRVQPGPLGLEAVDLSSASGGADHHHGD